MLSFGNLLALWILTFQLRKEQFCFSVSFLPCSLCLSFLVLTILVSLSCSKSNVYDTSPFLLFFVFIRKDFCTQQVIFKNVFEYNRLLHYLVLHQCHLQYRYNRCFTRKPTTNFFCVMYEIRMGRCRRFGWSNILFVNFLYMAFKHYQKYWVWLQILWNCFFRLQGNLTILKGSSQQ